MDSSARSSTIHRFSAPNSELNSPRSVATNHRITEDGVSPRRREDEKNILTISAVKRPNTPSMSSSLATDQIGKHHTESRSSSVPRSLNEPSFMKETFSNLQKHPNAVRANSPSTPRMKFGSVDYSKSRPHNSPVVHVKPPTQKTNTERIDVEVPAKTIQDLSIVIGLGVCIIIPSKNLLTYFIHIDTFDT